MNSERARNFLDAIERWISHKPFDVRNECAVQTRFCPEQFLRPLSISAQADDVQGKNLSRGQHRARGRSGDFLHCVAASFHVAFESAVFESQYGRAPKGGLLAKAMTDPWFPAHLRRRMFNPWRTEMRALRMLVAVASAAASLLAGCGGGGDGGGAATTTTSFPLLTGYRARIAGGSTDNFTVSGTCTGTATFTNGAATVSTFEGVTGFAVAQTATVTFTNCTPATNAVSGTGYYDGSYTPLGSSIPSVEYTKFLTAPPPLPTSVKVGDTAIYATLTTYTDSTKSVTTGQRILSYVVEADTANTAIGNLITKGYNASNQLLFTQQSRYRIAADGTLTAVSVDIQYSTTSTAHLVYTKS